jgi:hypothetical protein
MIHEVTRKAGTDAMQLIKIPYVADRRPAETAKVEISASPDDPFGQVNPVKVVWTGYSSGGFAWTPPVTPR